MPWRQCRPSCTQRSTAAARAWDLESCALMPEDAQPLSPLRCPPRSTDLSILSRSLTRPRKAGQGGRGGRRKGGVVYPRILTLSARPKASDNLAHHRYSSLASQLSCKQLSQSNRHIFSRCKLEPRMILSSRISPDLRNQTNTKCATAWGNLREAAHTSSTCGAARQKARPRYREALLCCKECRLSLRHLNLRSGLLWGTVIVRRRGRLWGHWDTESS